MTRYTKQQLADLLNEWVTKNGRTPTLKELSKSGLPAGSTYIRYFNSWLEALSYAGLIKPVVSHDRYKRERCAAILHRALRDAHKYKNDFINIDEYTCRTSALLLIQ